MSVRSKSASMTRSLEGWLEKKGEFPTYSYKRRYFRQVDDKLYYYTDEKAREEKGFIDLSGMFEVAPSSEKVKNLLPFVIKCPARTWYLAAPDDTFKYWTDGLAEYSQKKRARNSMATSPSHAIAQPQNQPTIQLPAHMDSKYSIVGISRSVPNNAASPLSSASSGLTPAGPSTTQPGPTSSTSYREKSSSLTPEKSESFSQEKPTSLEQNFPDRATQIQKRFSAGPNSLTRPSLEKGLSHSSSSQSLASEAAGPASSEQELRFKVLEQEKALQNLQLELKKAQDEGEEALKSAKSLSVKQFMVHKNEMSQMRERYDTLLDDFEKLKTSTAKSASTQPQDLSHLEKDLQTERNLVDLLQKNIIHLKNAQKEQKLDNEKLRSQLEELKLQQQQRQQEQQEQQEQQKQDHHQQQQAPQNTSTDNPENTTAFVSNGSSDSLQGAKKSSQSQKTGTDEQKQSQKTSLHLWGAAPPAEDLRRFVLYLSCGAVLSTLISDSAFFHFLFFLILLAWIFIEVDSLVVQQNSKKQL